MSVDGEGSSNNPESYEDKSDLTTVDGVIKKIQDNPGVNTLQYSIMRDGETIQIGLHKVNEGASGVAESYGECYLNIKDLEDFKDKIKVLGLVNEEIKKSCK